MTFRHLAMAAAVVAAAVSAACSAPTSGSAPRSTHPTSTSTAPAATPTSQQLHMTTVRLHRDASVGPGAINEAGDVAWTEGPKRGTENRVVLLRRGTSKPETIAQSEWRDGLINWVALAGSWVVYVDQSAVQSDAAPEVDWVIHANNLATKQKLVLARSPRANPWVPWIAAGAGGVTWATASPSRNADLWRWVPGTPVSATQKVLSNSELTPDDLTPTKDGIVYLGPNGKGIREHTLGGDCWIAPYDGSAPKVLTHTALGMSCAVGGDTLVYSLHIDPSQPTKEEIGDDPHEIWTQPLGDPSKARRIEQGYIQARPLVGDSYLTWVGQGGRYVATFDGSRQLLTADEERAGFNSDAQGDLFLTYRTNENWTSTITLVTVHRHG